MHNQESHAKKVAFELNIEGQKEFREVQGTEK